MSLVHHYRYWRKIKVHYKATFILCIWLVVDVFYYCIANRSLLYVRLFLHMHFT